MRILARHFSPRSPDHNCDQNLQFIRLVWGLVMKSTKMTPVIDAKRIAFVDYRSSHRKETWRCLGLWGEGAATLTGTEHPAVARAFHPIRLGSRSTLLPFPPNHGIRGKLVWLHSFRIKSTILSLGWTFSGRTSSTLISLRGVPYNPSQLWIRIIFSKSVH